MDNIYNAAKKLGDAKSYTSYSNTPYVSVVFNNERWTISKQKFYIMTCNEQYAVISENENDIISALNELLNGKRPVKNEVAKTMSKLLTIVGNYE